MSRDAMFKSILDPVIIKTGWHLAHGDSRDDFASDPIAYADFAFLKEERFRFIIEQIRHKRHRVARLIDIDLPKGDLAVRPGNVLPIEESTILHAALYLLAPRIDGKLLSGVYSYRLAKDWKKRVQKAKDLFDPGDVDNIPFLKRKTIRSISLEEPWYNAWPEFDAAAVKAVKEKGYTHLTKTDISAYFENIDLSLLETLLRELLPHDGEIIALVIRMLEGWTRRTISGVPIGRGIPQGNDVSSFLGNIYLIPLDRALQSFCNRYGGVWFRYVDDVKVFTKSYEDARRAVFIINDSLRGLHLNLQSAKTAILSGSRLQEELHDPQLELINDLIADAERITSANDAKKSKALVASAAPVFTRFTRKLPESVTGLGGRESRLLRRCLTFVGMLRSPRLRRAAVAAVCRVPDVRMLRSGLGYLGKMSEHLHDKIADDLLAAFDEQELLFPYQLAAIIEMFKHLSVKDPRRIASRLRQAGWKKRAHWYVRQKTLETIAVLPYTEKNAATLVAEGLQDEHPWVRRAAVALLPRASVETVRRRVNELSYHPDWDVARIALFWRRHLEDHGTAAQALSMKSNAAFATRSFLRQVPVLYLLRCNESPTIGKLLREYLRQHRLASRHSLVRWHCNTIGAELDAWVDKNTGASTPPRH